MSGEGRLATQTAVGARELVRRLWRGFRGEIASIIRLALVSSGATVVEVAALATLVVLAKLVAEGKASYAAKLPVFGAVEATTKELLLAGVVFTAARFLSQLLAGYMEARLVARYVGRVRLRLVDAFIDATWDAKSELKASELQTLLTANIDRVSHLLTSLAGGVMSAGNAAVLLVSAVAVSPPYALGMVVGAVLLFVLLRPLSLYARRRLEADSEFNLRFATDVQELVALAREIEVFGASGAMKKRIAATVDEAMGKQIAAGVAQRAINPVYQNAVVLFALIAIGAVALLDIPRIELLGVVVVLLLRMASYTQGLQSVYHHVINKAVFLDQLELEQQRLRRGVVADGIVPLPRLESVELDHVRYAYGRGEEVLVDVSAKLTRGETIGIVGPSGAGKSTLVRLLLGLHLPSSGVVAINGRPVAELKRSDWRARVAYVPQEPVLLDDSVRDNVRFFRDDISDARIEEACRAASIASTIDGLPKGYATTVGDRGGLLSVGQRQRLCIARALAGDPDVIVLDEPTSALDPISEHAIQEALEAQRGKRLTIIVAHRLATLDRCDRVMVLDRGRLVALDTPVRLLESNAFYRQSRAVLDHAQPSSTSSVAQASLEQQS